MFVHIFTSITRSGVAPLVSRTVATYGTQFKSHAFKFFTSYSNFTLNRDAPPTREFRRLKRLKGWKDDDKEYAKARERFADALAEDFNVKYGTDVNNIDHWHALCHVCRVDPVPKGISACRKVRTLGEMSLIFGPLTLLFPHRLSSRASSTLLIWFTTRIKSGRFLLSKRLPGIRKGVTSYTRRNLPRLAEFFATFCAIFVKVANNPILCPTTT